MVFVLGLERLSERVKKSSLTTKPRQPVWSLNLALTFPDFVSCVWGRLQGLRDKPSLTSCLQKRPNYRTSWWSRFASAHLLGCLWRCDVSGPFVGGRSSKRAPGALSDASLQTSSRAIESIFMYTHTCVCSCLATLAACECQGEAERRRRRMEGEGGA